MLKPSGEKYLKSLFHYAMDNENKKYMCHLPNKTVDKTEEFLIKVENEWKREKPKFLEFAIKYNEIHIVAVGVYLENGIGELGRIINKNYWGNGFTYEASKALIYYTKTLNKSKPFSGTL